MNDNRRKLVGILKLLYENTDADHSMNTYQIMDALETMGYGRPDRKTIDSNIKFLIEDLEMGIVKIKGKPNKYKWTEREFDLEELQILVDALYSARFISVRKTRELVAKLKDLTSIHQASILNRDMYAAPNFKYDGTAALASANTVNEAIKSGKKISFQLSDHDIYKNEILKDDGETYIVSPYGIVCSGNHYYAIGMSDADRELHTYRIDKIRNIAISHHDAVLAPVEFSINDYPSRVFDIDSDTKENVQFICRTRTMDAFIDKFGKDFHTESVDEGRFSVNVTVDIDPAFYAWVFSFGGDVRIVSPEYVRHDFESQLRKQLLTV